VRRHFFVSPASKLSRRSTDHELNWQTVVIGLLNPVRHRAAQTVPANLEYQIVELKNGVRSVRSLKHAETFHPVVGPAVEAEALYVRQLCLPERLAAFPGEFVVWDVGLGAAANALTAIKSISAQLDQVKCLRLFSFDQTTSALKFALAHSTELDFLGGYDAQAATLLDQGFVEFTSGKLRVQWQLCLGDFPALLSSGSVGRSSAGSVRQIGTLESSGAPLNREIPAPHAILFDPHSPQKNPTMWTVPLFTRLFQSLDPQRSCALANYTRSTLARTSMLLGGFFVGVGHATGEKEETTVAANALDLIEEPLTRRWLERIMHSDSAEPLWEPVHIRAKLTPQTIEKLCSHPQFKL
jgi:hypothetical protein